MKKSFNYLLIMLFALSLGGLVIAEESFNDEDVTFDENGQAENATEAAIPDEDPNEITTDKGVTFDTNPEGVGEGFDAVKTAVQAEKAKKEGKEVDEEALKEALKGPLFKCPTWKEFSVTLHSKAGSDRVINTFTSKVNLKDQKDLDALFKWYRNRDVKIIEFSNHSSRLASAWKGHKITFKESDHFLAAYPAKCKGLKDGKVADMETETYYEIEKLLAAADQAYLKAVETLGLDGFMNWAGKLKGKIYFVVDNKNWLIVRGTDVKKSPVKTVYAENGYREFYVYLNPKNILWNAEALGYAVAEEVLTEFLLVSNKKGRVNDFLRVGFAAYCSGLSSVITESGPVQVSRFQNKPVTYDNLVKVAEGKLPFKSFPLEKSALISIDQFVANGEPSEDTKLFYYMRQSAALVQFFTEKDSLPMIYLFYKSFRSNRRFDEDYDNYFASLHRDAFMGEKSEIKDDKSKDSKDKKEKKGKTEAAKDDEEKETADLGSNYKVFRNRVTEAVWYPLTVDEVAKDIQDSKEKEKAKSKDKDSKAKKSDRKPSRDKDKEE